MKEDKLRAATLLGAELMIEHGLSDWKLDIVNKRTTLGETYYRTKTIELSQRFILVSTKDEFRETMLHEIAHALIGPGYAHGPVFVEKCLAIGGNPESSGDISIRSYHYECPKCGAHGGNNRLAEAYCTACFNRGDMVKLNVTKNKIEVRSW